MGPAQPIALRLTRELAPLGLIEWASSCAGALAAGDRLMTLFGRPGTGDEVITTAVLQSVHGRLEVLRGRGDLGQSFPSLTARYPCAQMFERELWEQTGLMPDGHPWLKPVRYEGARQQRMAEHPSSLCAARRCTKSAWVRSMRA
jgi:hypothetical protein